MESLRRRSISNSPTLLAVGMEGAPVEFEVVALLLLLLLWLLPPGVPLPIRGVDGPSSSSPPFVGGVLIFTRFDFLLAFLFLVLAAPPAVRTTGAFIIICVGVCSFLYNLLYNQDAINSGG